MFAASEVLADHHGGAVAKTLQRFFQVASAKGIIQTNVTDVMLQQITLRSKAGASCLAIVCKSGQGAGTSLIQAFSGLTCQQSDPIRQISGALCIGEFGKRVDLSSNKAGQGFV
jgi:hypothetical protein